MLFELLEPINLPAGQWALYVLTTFVLTLLVQDAFLTGSMYWKKPRHILIHGPTLAFGKWWSSLWFILRAPQLIMEGYQQVGPKIFARGDVNEGRQSPSKFFAIPARENWLVFVGSEDQIREVENSPIDQLSFHQAMEDRLKVKHLFAGFETGRIDPHDAVPIRVLKTLLRVNIPGLRERIQGAIEGAFHTHVDNSDCSSEGWSRVNTFQFMEDVSIQVNCTVIFGERLSGIEDFINAARDYHRQAVVAMLISEYFPRWTDKFIVPGILSLGGALKKLKGYLTLEVSQRLYDIYVGERYIPKDGITWVIEASTTKDQRTVKRIVQQIISIFFASAGQLPALLMYSMYKLCEHAEYVKPLRDEVEAMLKLPATDQYKRLPLMESFLRETARLHPLDSLSVQRKVMKDFTFRDGSHVLAGNVISVPQQPVMRDPEYYDRPNEFLPFRFVNEDNDDRNEGPIRKLTDLRPHFYLWGATAKPCPGRWYASAVMQQFFVHLLTKYNFKLADPNAKMTWTYTTIVFPRPGLEILVQER